MVLRNSVPVASGKSQRAKTRPRLLPEPAQPPWFHGPQHQEDALIARSAASARAYSLGTPTCLPVRSNRLPRALGTVNIGKMAFIDRAPRG